MQHQTPLLEEQLNHFQFFVGSRLLTENPLFLIYAIPKEGLNEDEKKYINQWDKITKELG